MPILRGRDARMSEELMDLLIGECFERATYNRKVRTDKPAVHLRKAGFCEQFGRWLWMLCVTGARPVELRNAEAYHYQNGRLLFRWNAGCSSGLWRILANGRREPAGGGERPA